MKSDAAASGAGTSGAADAEIFVYCAAVPFAAGGGEVFPAARAALIAQTKNPSLKAQRRSVWALLEYALLDALGLKLRELNAACTPDGKWYFPGGECFFSLSHTSGAVAAAVSKRCRCGVDIEALADAEARFSEGLRARIFDPEEAARCDALPAEKKARFAAISWTKKESIFKQRDFSDAESGAFVPKAVCSLHEPTASRLFRPFPGGAPAQFIVSAAGEANASAEKNAAPSLFSFRTPAGAYFPPDDDGAVR